MKYLQLPNPAEERLDKNKWKCERCTLHNWKSTAKCSACGTKRPSMKRKRKRGDSDGDGATLPPTTNAPPAPPPAAPPAPAPVAVTDVAASRAYVRQRQQMGQRHVDELAEIEINAQQCEICREGGSTLLELTYGENEEEDISCTALIHMDCLKSWRDVRHVRNIRVFGCTSWKAASAPPTAPTAAD